MPETEGHLAYAIHTEANCPLNQDTPEMADRLADNLAEAGALGGFYMKRHQGVALGEGSATPELLETYQTVLPQHDVTLQTVDLDEFRHFHDPEAMDDSAVRQEFFKATQPHFPEAELLPSGDERGANLSLRQLPDYLRQHAPGR